MNGEELYTALDKRLTVMEQMTIERWNTNDGRLTTIEKTLEEIRDNLSKLPCGIHLEKMQSLQKQVNWLWSIIGIVFLGGLIGFITKAFLASLRGMIQ